MEATTALTSFALILGRSDSEEFLYVKRMVSATQHQKWVVNSWVSGEKCTKSISCWSGKGIVPEQDTGVFQALVETKWVMPGNSKGFGIRSGRWFLGMNLGTSLMETCLALNSNVVNSRLWVVLERATSSDPHAPVAKGTRKAVL